MLPSLLNGSSSTNRVSTLFDRLLDSDLMSAAPWSATPIAMWQDEHNLYVELDAPGVTDKDVEITFHNGELVILGERKGERKEGGHDTRRYGKFGQRVTISVPVDVEKIDAAFSNGVLKVTLPKSEAAKPRRIALRAGE